MVSVFISFQHSILFYLFGFIFLKFDQLSSNVYVNKLIVDIFMSSLAYKSYDEMMSNSKVYIYVFSNEAANFQTFVPKFSINFYQIDNFGSFE